MELFALYHDTPGYMRLLGRSVYEFGMLCDDYILILHGIEVWYCIPTAHRGAGWVDFARPALMA